MYLLMLLKLQLDGRLDAVAGVLVGLPQGQVHGLGFSKLTTAAVWKIDWALD